MVQEAHRRGQDQHVVMVGGAAHERADALDPVADLESETFGEEGGRGGVVGAAEHGVAELARAHPVRPGEPGRPGVRPVEPARAVVRGGRDRVLPDPRRHVEDDAGAGDGFGCADAGPVVFRRHAEGGQAGRGAGQVVRVVGADPQLEQAPDR
jgi:hypothetical protein